MVTVKRGMIINGEFVEGARNGLGVFVPTRYRRGAKGQLVMLPRPVGKRRRVSRVKRHPILEFVLRTFHRPGAGGDGCRLGKVFAHGKSRETRARQLPEFPGGRRDGNARQVAKPLREKAWRRATWTRRSKPRRVDVAPLGPTWPHTEKVFMSKLIDLRRQRQYALDKADSITAAAERANRTMTESEELEFEASMTTVNALNPQIAKIEKTATIMDLVSDRGAVLFDGGRQFTKHKTVRLTEQYASEFFEYVQSSGKKNRRGHVRRK